MLQSDLNVFQEKANEFHFYDKFSSKEWKEFRGFCFSAFRILRRHANVVLNLFSLMLDSGIPDIAVEKEKAVQKVEQR